MIDTTTYGIAENNGKIWNDREEMFTNLPSNLKGANVANVSAERLNQGAKNRLLVREPSIIYLIHRHAKSHESFLRHGGWSPFDKPLMLINGSKTMSWITGTADNAITIPLPPKSTFSILFKGKNIF